MTQTLKSGASVSHYEVVSPLGAGGMGEVYRALDNTLERPVALKILPPDLVRNEDRVRRFVREAKAASSLSHPNIVHIYEIGQSAEPPVHFIAMELVEGLTLADQIHRERTDLRKLLGYLAQVADALAKAHGAGIVHRDLKPENIMVTRDGFAKVLDFGVAKLIERRHSGETGTGDPTFVPKGGALTSEGSVIGTVGYMSPEQAMGREVDHRSDIFSFGCILYEAATRRRPFEASSDVDTLHKIIHDTPHPVEAINPSVPADLVRLIRRCLEKEPDRRIHSMKDLSLELAEIVQHWDHGRAPAIAGKRRLVVSALAAVLVVAAAAGIWKWSERAEKRSGSRPGNAPASAMTIRKLTGSGNVLRAAISPDGNYVAYIVRDGRVIRVLVRQVAIGNEVEVARDEREQCAEVEWFNVQVQFTPDGQFINYACHYLGPQYTVPLLGGIPRVTLEHPALLSALSPDGTRLAFFREEPSGDGSLLVGDARGNDTRVLFSEINSWSLLPLEAPVWSPNGDMIAVMVQSGNDLMLMAIDSRSGRAMAIGTTRWARLFSPVWLPDGSGLIVAGKPADSDNDSEQLWRIDWPSGAVTRVISDLNRYFSVSVSADGRHLLAVQANLPSRVRVEPLDHSAPAVLLPTGPDRVDGWGGIAWTSDGRVIYPIQDNGVRRLWTAKPDGSSARMISSDASAVSDISPVISPITGEVVFVQRDSSGSSIWKMKADGSGRTPLSSGPNDNYPSVSPGGEWVTYTSFNPKRLVKRVPLRGGATQTIYDKPGARQNAISPDGTRVAVALGQEIVIVPAAGGPPLQSLKTHSIDWRSSLQWIDNGEAIAYVHNEGGVFNVWKQPIAGGPPKQVTDFKEGLILSYAMSPDGQWLAYAQGSVLADVVLITDFQ